MYKLQSYYHNLKKYMYIYIYVCFTINQYNQQSMYFVYKVDREPSVLASLQYSKLCVAIDKSITIFEDETCDKILYHINFPSTIVRYCISKDGVFLFVVLATKILCLHLSDGKQIFTK